MTPNPPDDRQIDSPATRIGAIVWRHVYILRRSWPRILELAYWPTLQMIMWGFMTLYLAQHSDFFVRTAGMLIAAVLLWDVLFRGQLGVTISFLEEMWSRNLGHIFVSPIRPYEFVASLTVMSILRTVIGVVPAAILAIFLYSYSVFDMGLPLLAFFANLLVMGWAIGLMICGILLRWGQGAESLAWLVVFLVAPFSGIYYPLSVFPEWLQVIAWSLPSAHVFEGMRAVLITGIFRWDLFAVTVALNIFYLGIGAIVFFHFFRIARERGLILQQGE